MSVEGVIERQAEKQVERRGVQIARMLLVVDILKRLNHATLAELQWNLGRSGVRVCDRTLRRDLAILARLNWCKPKTGVKDKTVWKWTKE